MGPIEEFGAELGAAIARLVNCPHGEVMHLGAVRVGAGATAEGTGWRLCLHCGAVNGGRGKWELSLYVAELRRLVRP
jgi:hypothetical protein